MLSLFDSIINYFTFSNKSKENFKYDRLLKKNAQYFYSINGKNNKKNIKKESLRKKIYILHIDHYLSLILNENIWAQQVKKNTDYDIVAISPTFYSRDIEMIDESFGVQYKSFVKEVLKNPFLCIKPLITSFLFMLINPTPDKLLKLKYNSIPIGNPVYDQIYFQMVDLKEKFSLEKLDWKIGFKALFEGMCIVEYSTKMFKKSPPYCCIISESTYNRSIAARVAVYYGSDILNTTYWGTFLSKNEKVKNMELNARQDAIEYIERYEKNKMPKNQIVTTKFTEPYPNIQNDKLSLLNELGINNGKKNVIIMLHCFKDCPRGQAAKNIYKDFYDWFIDTLEQIKHIRNVNWIIKDHPYSKAYKQYSEVNRIRKKYTKTNIIFYNNAYNPNFVSLVADCIVTIAGTILTEAPAMGIPCVTAGIPYGFNDIGIYTSKSKQEYYKLLKNITSLNKLDKNDIEVANRRYSLWKREGNTFDKIISEYNSIVFNFNVTEKQIRIANYNLIKQYTMLLDDNIAFDKIVTYNEDVKHYIYKRN